MLTLTNHPKTFDESLPFLTHFNNSLQQCCFLDIRLYRNIKVRCKLLQEVPKGLPSCR